MESFQLPVGLQMKMAVFMLVLVRITGLFALTPFFGGPAVPQRLKAMLAAGIAICVAPLLDHQGAEALRAFSTPLSASLTILSELAIGLIAGLLVALVIGAVQTAGQFIAHDVGMTLANIIDPLSNRQISVIGQLLATMAVLVFLLLDFHHHMIRLVTKSFELLPVATFARRSVLVATSALERVARVEGNELYRTAMHLAIPVTVTLVLVTVAMAFLARSVPEINVFILGFAIRILVGFFVIITMFPLLGRLYEALFERAVRNSWDLIRVFSGS